ncbi:hypothetical protein [Amycolatopsis plumensis]|uniref:Uncharacterized protein n=1 Tax=Amycolatopsis plumensis TaxID=236508 RepID=A0ABV5U0I3_9PSEU
MMRRGYLFGHRRIDLLTPQLDQADDRKRTERRERRARLEKRAADFARKQSNILSQAEDADPTDPDHRTRSRRPAVTGHDHP